jgi:hypothetical protein
VHRVVIPGEQVPGGHRDLRDLFRALPVPDVARPERQLEPLAVFGPHLRHPERVRHVIVLHPGQMPAQPRDRVRVAVQPDGQLAAGQTPHRLVHGFLNAAEGVSKNFRTRHRLIPSGQSQNYAERTA